MTTTTESAAPPAPMREYPKIYSPYLRHTSGPQRNQFTDTWARPEFECLAAAPWHFTEKVDGTNVRIHWDGHRSRYGGRTENAQLPAKLVNWLDEHLPEELFEQAFGDTTVTLYGEGYGAGIQKAGALYAPDQRFILFDVLASVVCPVHDSRSVTPTGRITPRECASPATTGISSSAIQTGQPRSNSGTLTTATASGDANASERSDDVLTSSGDSVSPQMSTTTSSPSRAASAPSAASLNLREGAGEHRCPSPSITATAVEQYADCSAEAATPPSTQPRTPSPSMYGLQQLRCTCVGRSGGWWLERANVEDVGSKLGLDVVPLFRTCSLYEAMEAVLDGVHSSWTGSGQHLAEGLVGVPTAGLLTRAGERIMVKIKTKDFRR